MIITLFDHNITQHIHVNMNKEHEMLLKAAVDLEFFVKINLDSCSAITAHFKEYFERAAILQSNNKSTLTCTSGAHTACNSSLGNSKSSTFLR